MSDFELGYLAATVLALFLSIPYGLVCLAIGWVNGDKIFNNSKKNKNEADISEVEE